MDNTALWIVVFVTLPLIGMLLHQRKKVVVALRAGILVLDVRTPAEFASGHVRGAINIPHDQLASRLSELGEPGRILIYCRSGARSGRASRVLKQAGFEVIDAKRLAAIPAEFRT